MDIKLKTGGIMAISDNSVEAIKIKQGYSYTINKEGIFTFGKKDKFDMENFENKLKNKNATLDDIQEFILNNLIELIKTRSF